MSTIVEVDLGENDKLTVEVSPWGAAKCPGKEGYNIRVNGEVKHGSLDANETMGALGNYIHSLSHQIKKNKPVLGFCLPPASE